MKKRKKSKMTAYQSVAFILIVVMLFVGLDFFLKAANPVASSAFFRNNDHEITIALNESNEFDKVFYGSSPVVSAYRPDLSDSGFTEMGIVYGKITYLLKMLEKGIITVNDEIVLGLSIAVFMDELTTDRSYIWHKGTFEPYIFFYRDRLMTFVNRAMHNFIDGDFELPRHYNYEKWLYYGSVSDEELEEMIETHTERFWNLDISVFYENLAALEALIDYCAGNGIRLRAIWMPVNPSVPVPDVYAEVFGRANEIMSNGGVEVCDMTSSFGPVNFHDIGHMNFETGAVAFTEAFDEWVGS